MPRSRTTLALLTAGTAVALLTAACGGTSASSSSASTSTTSAAAAAAGSSAMAVTGSKTGVTVETHQGPDGTYLTDAAGRTLYLFAADKGGMSACYGACAHFWPPLTTTGTAKAAGSAQAGKLSTTKRTDGKTQVTYNGHPLYYFVEDTKAGQANGQGKNLSGGLWWILSPAGTAIMHAAPAAAPKSSSGGSGGGGGWG